MSMCWVPVLQSGPGDKRLTLRKVGACTVGQPSCPKGSTSPKGYIGIVVWSQYDGHGYLCHSALATSTDHVGICVRLFRFFLGVFVMICAFYTSRGDLRKQGLLAGPLQIIVSQGQSIVEGVHWHCGLVIVRRSWVPLP